MDFFGHVDKDEEPVGDYVDRRVSESNDGYDDGDEDEEEEEEEEEEEDDYTSESEEASEEEGKGEA